MTLDTTTLARLRRKIGDPGVTQSDGSVRYTFQDSELEDIYTEAGSSLERAVLICFEELLGNAWKFTDYTQNESSERKNQIFQNLLKMVERQQAKINKGSQVRIVGMKAVPPASKEMPQGDTLYPPAHDPASRRPSDLPWLPEVDPADWA